MTIISLPITYNTKLGTYDLGLLITTKIIKVHILGLCYR